MRLHSELFNVLQLIIQRTSVLIMKNSDEIVLEIEILDHADLIRISTVILLICANVRSNLTFGS